MSIKDDPSTGRSKVKHKLLVLCDLNRRTSFLSTHSLGKLRLKPRPTSIKTDTMHTELSTRVSTTLNSSITYGIEGLNKA